MSDARPCRRVCSPPSDRRLRKGCRSEPARVSAYDRDMNLRMPQPEQSLAGRTEAMLVSDAHFFNGNRLTPPFPAGLKQVVFGTGCFFCGRWRIWVVAG